MRTRLLAFSLILTTSSAAKAQNIPDFNFETMGGESGQRIAFVGEKIALDELSHEEWCPENNICMDAAFNARYKIIDLLEGDYEGDTIDFRVYDHYGTPKFADHDRVIIYLVQSGTKLYHQKYKFDPLYSTDSGDYAFCGDPYYRYSESSLEENGREDLATFIFSPDVTFKLSDFLYSQSDISDIDQRYIRENYVTTMTRFAPPAFEIEGGIARCKMGLTAAEVAQIRMEFEFDPEREFEEAYSKCWEDSGLDRSASYSGNEFADSGFIACKMALPKLEN